MRCTVCDKEIKVDDGEQYVQISNFEFIYGDQAIYPNMTERMTLCSLGCIETLLNNWRAVRAKRGYGR